MISKFFHIGTLRSCRKRVEEGGKRVDGMQRDSLRGLGKSSDKGGEPEAKVFCFVACQCHIVRYLSLGERVPAISGPHCHPTPPVICQENNMLL